MENACCVFLSPFSLKRWPPVRRPTSVTPINCSAYFFLPNWIFSDEFSRYLKNRDNHLINNYWMRLSTILWIIKTEVCVICRSRRLRQITQTRGFDNSWYDAKTEFSNCFIIHFSHNSSSETEAKRSAICFWGKHSKGLSNQADVELNMINAISAADIAFIMSSSQAIVNWLNALDQSDFS